MPPGFPWRCFQSSGGISTDFAVALATFNFPSSFFYQFSSLIEDLFKRFRVERGEHEEENARRKRKRNGTVYIATLNEKDVQGGKKCLILAIIDKFYTFDLMEKTCKEPAAKLVLNFNFLFMFVLYLLHLSKEPNHSFGKWQKLRQISNTH